jgi:hypothetical protein
LLRTQQLDAVDRATAAYENALKKDPTNESLLQSIFFSYAREFRYKEQQDVCFKLLLNNNNNYDKNIMNYHLFLFSHFN